VDSTGFLAAARSPPSNASYTVLSEPAQHSTVTSTTTRRSSSRALQPEPRSESLACGDTSRDGGEEGEGGGPKVERDGGATAAPAHAPVGLLRQHLQRHVCCRRGKGTIGAACGFAIASVERRGQGMSWGDGGSAAPVASGDEEATGGWIDSHGTVR
jgi:hypothetical protein